LTLWRNGLALEDGPLISYTSPEGQEFLRGVNEGRAPISLLGVQPGQRVDLHVQRNMDEDYKGPSVSAKPFQGSGNRLGSIVPSAKPYNIIENESQIQDASHTYEINPNLPQTSIQIRLSDGRRLVAKFNHSHTLSDLYNYVQASINSTQPFTLQTTFPTKKLEKSDITLSEANLLNSAVVQRPL
ncbi:SEP-domain-containing protein, partial [Neoconidiobolus thromboides FSU 785]